MPWRWLEVGDAVGQLDHPDFLRLLSDPLKAVLHLVVFRFEVSVLGQGQDAIGHSKAELGGKLFIGYAGILDHVVEQGALEGQVTSRPPS